MLLPIAAPVIPAMILFGSYAEDHMKRQWTALSRLGSLDELRGLATLKVFGRAADDDTTYPTGPGSIVGKRAFPPNTM